MHMAYLYYHYIFCTVPSEYTAATATSTDATVQNDTSNESMCS